MMKFRPVKIILILLAVIALLIGVLLVAMATFDWNRAKPWINERTSEAIGRPFMIQGDLALTWEKPEAGTDKYTQGWRRMIPWPHLVAQDIHIGNPAGFVFPQKVAKDVDTKDSDKNANTDTNKGKDNDANKSANKKDTSKQDIASKADDEKSVNSEAINKNDANGTPEMASLQRLSFSLNPLALLNKTISVPEIQFDQPALTLLRKADGTNNWTFAKKQQGEKRWELDIQQVVFSKGSVHLVDAVKHIDATADIETIGADDDSEVATAQVNNTASKPATSSAAAASSAQEKQHANKSGNKPNYGVQWKLYGKMNGEKITGSGKAGSVLSLENQTTPYPVMAEVHAGKTSVKVEGTVTKPSALAALDLRLKMSGVSMARLYALTGLVLPETPPYTTEGRLKGELDGERSHWVYENFKGKVGQSDINGTLDFLSHPGKQARPLLSGKIVSNALHFSDLGPVVGADSNASKVERGAAADNASDKVLPTEQFKTERWTSIDADVKFSAQKIIRDKALPINKLTSNVKLKDGVVSLKPLDFDMAGGRLKTDIVLDGRGGAGKEARKNTIKATMKVSAQHLKLNELFPTLPQLQASIGEINGEASLSATGGSIADLLAASNGEVKTLIDHGTISKLLLEQMGLNVGNIVLSTLFGDKQVKLNCMATDFGVTNGVMQTRTFVVDTDEAVLDINGNINLAQEKLDLTIRPNSKGLRIFSLRSPLYVRGTFKKPDVSVDKGVLAAKAGSAVALAAVAPFAALLPLVNTGPDRDSPCRALLAQARTKPVAPPPGKTNPRSSAR